MYHYVSSGGLKYQSVTVRTSLYGMVAVRALTVRLEFCFISQDLIVSI